ncbi:hypothetical protein LCGC14_0955090 [marine sediment metagenome]|uniref:Uncharacterized protein n=1 Tax=marine sediment metagenome TaxID=412755 RepID=A0A0F9RMJ3_9ZZZZ
MIGKENLYTARRELETAILRLNNVDSKVIQECTMIGKAKMHAERAIKVIRRLEATE